MILPLLRVKYMIGCLQSLQERYQQAGSQLLILQNDPVVAIPKLAAALKAKAVFWNWDVEPYSQIRDLAVIDALKTHGIEFLNHNWDQLLHSPTEIFSGAKTPYTVYTPFWKNWITKSKAKPVTTVESLENLTEKNKKLLNKLRNN